MNDLASAVDRFRDSLFGEGASARRPPGFHLAYISRDDLRFIVTGTLILCALRAVTDRLFFRLGKRFGIRSDTATAKFAECTWYSISYVILFAFGAYAQLPEKGFGFNAEYFFGQYPNDNLSSTLRHFYLVYLAFYTHCWAHLLYTPRKKDFRVMLIHHVATVGVVLISWMFRLFKVGAAIMSIHDVGDIFLYGTKAFFYVHGRCAITEGGFAVFAISFFLTRILVFPKVVYATLVDIHHYLPVNPREFFRYYLANAALITLQCLHVFWFYLILKMVSPILLRTQPAKDIRSDSESDEDEEEKKKVQRKIAHRKNSASKAANGKAENGTSNGHASAHSQESEGKKGK
eukprot:tig00022075_g23626.t1